MHYLIAFDKFKGSLSAPEAVSIAERTILEQAPSSTVTALPLTDGGEGFASILSEVLGGRLREVMVTGPRFEPVMGRFSLVETQHIPGSALERLDLPRATRMVAFVEMASASGYECLDPSDRDPWKTTTMGTGELMLAATRAGADAIVLGIGGSATNDCGAGALEALGVHYYDRELQPVNKVTPQEFKRINTLGSTSHLINSFPPVRIACDVTNPLLGENGATRVFGPQKGLSPDTTDAMERNLRKMGCRILGLFGKDPVTWDEWMSEPGSGAAGGIGFALRHALPDSRFVEGFPLVAELLGMQEAISRADLILTGEGRLDKSSLQGKGPVGLLRMAAQGQPVVMACGSVDHSIEAELAGTCPGLAVVTLSDPEWPLGKALAETANSLQSAVIRILSSS